MKTADSVLLSLFVRSNGKCNNSHPPPPPPQLCLKRYSAFRENPMLPKDQNLKKYQQYIDAQEATDFCFYCKHSFPLFLAQIYPYIRYQPDISISLVSGLEVNVKILEIYFYLDHINVDIWEAKCDWDELNIPY